MSEQSHTCDALVLSCIDFRFHEGLVERVREEIGIERFDLVALAGGTKNIVTPGEPYVTDAVMRNIEIAVELHGITTVILTNHMDCGAYGGSKSFASLDEEINFHKSELSRGRYLVRQRFPKLDTKAFLVYKEESEVKLLPI